MRIFYLVGGIIHKIKNIKSYQHADTYLCDFDTSMVITTSKRMDNAVSLGCGMVGGIFFFMCRVLVTEKEGRMKEALRMMGLPDVIYHGSWFITFQVQVQVPWANR